MGTFGEVLASASASAAATELRASVVIDYQNVHLTGHDLFEPHAPKHETLIDPLLFAGRLLATRNTRKNDRHQQIGAPLPPAAVLGKVLVFRGQPVPEYDPRQHARSQAQQSHWQRDPRVTVRLRPLKYDLERDAGGQPVPGPGGGAIVRGKREKGIDVLCALALVREARDPSTDLVILASHDSDLEPALDEALDQKTATVETFSWYSPAEPWRGTQLRPTDGRRTWNTRLNAGDFQTARDRSGYA